MNPTWSVVLIFLLDVACYNAENVAEKHKSSISPFKVKLARSGLATKPILSAALLAESETQTNAYLNISDLGISVPPEDINDTVISDHHFYYNSTFYIKPINAKRYWINFDTLPDNHVVHHQKLSDSYRQATTIELSFDFPFYGSPLRNVTIATGGFLYMGDYLHNWIAATQYVAPLMANFDTSMSQSSVIKYADNGTAFTVLWDHVYIKNRKNDGAFTFQVTLLKNGDIVFAYKDIPYKISDISDTQHPVKVGLSDAYILERQVFFVRRKTVYEYSRIHNDKVWNIANNTALYFTALPTCNSFKDSTSCLSSELKLNCSWCEAVKRCSDGIDRQRQNWIVNGCVENKVTISPTVSMTTVSTTTVSTTTTVDKSEITTFIPTKVDIKTVSETTSKFETHNTFNVDQNTNLSGVSESSNEAAAHLIKGDNKSSQSSISPGGIATIMIFIIAMVAVSFWIFYAYKYPQSSSGQFLIKYRPSQWPLKKESNGTSSNSRHI